MGAVISIGQELIIPETDIKTKAFDPNYNYYTVMPKEGILSPRGEAWR